MRTARWQWGRKDCITGLSKYLAEESSPPEMRDSRWWLKSIGGHPADRHNERFPSGLLADVKKEVSLLEDIHYKGCRAILPLDKSIYPFAPGHFGFLPAQSKGEDHLLFWIHRNLEAYSYGYRGLRRIHFRMNPGALNRDFDDLWAEKDENKWPVFYRLNPIFHWTKGAVK